MGTVFNIQEYAVQDGPGIRTVVFLKGCPLRCRWCSNPEGQRPEPELLHSHALCRRCGTCAQVCPQEAVAIDAAGYPRFRRALCRRCSEPACTQACPQRALRIVGQSWTPEKLYARIQSNALFYRNSQGGLTLSGGEPLAQPAFVGALMDRCADVGLSVGIETCGLFDWDSVAGYIERFDFYYFDVKCLDPRRHRQFTGAGNETIRRNLARLAALDPAKIVLTITVVPGVNADAETVAAIAALGRELRISRARLLPYHTLGQGKYRDLGRRYRMAGSIRVDPAGLAGRWKRPATRWKPLPGLTTGPSGPSTS